MSDHSSNARATAEPKRSLTWRPIDIVIVAILGVATGFIFVVWNNIGYAWFTAMDNLTPGLGGLAVGIWLLGGVLGGLIIRKPGAAIFVEVLRPVFLQLWVRNGGRKPSIPVWHRGWVRN